MVATLQFGFVKQPYSIWFYNATLFCTLPGMARKRFDDSNCSVARALNEVGDWWSLLIVLHAMYGTRRFVDFQQELGIAKNILCDRLARLVGQRGIEQSGCG